MQVNESASRKTRSAPLANLRLFAGGWHQGVLQTAMDNINQVFNMFMTAQQNMHFHGIKKDNSLARVAVGCYLRPSVCDFCSLPAEAAEEEKAK
jgi:hypothetical protein